MLDNEIYDRLADTWWDEEGILSSYGTAFNPVRMRFCQRVFKTLGVDPKGKRALDIGCGGGRFTELIAGMGFAASGVDPSQESIRAAKAHAAASGLTIDYRVGFGELLPFEQGAFDVVFACDVLEHVNDAEKVIAQAARVLKPGGVLIYETINRTLYTWLAVIQLAQNIPLTRFYPQNYHVFEKFITPNEIETMLRRHRLRSGEQVGVDARADVITLAIQSLRYKLGAITLKRFSESLRIGETLRMDSVYLGYAIKRED